MSERRRRYELKRARSQERADGSVLAIGQLARAAGVASSAIRYYEARGLLPAPGRSAGRRVFGRDALDALAAIALAKRAGFTLAETRVLLSGARVRRLRAKQREIDARIAAAREMKRVLALLAACGCKTLLACGRRVNASHAAEGA